MIQIEQMLDIKMWTTLDVGFDLLFIQINPNMDYEDYFYYMYE